LALAFQCCQFSCWGSWSHLLVFVGFSQSVVWECHSCPAVLGVRFDWVAVRAVSAGVHDLCIPSFHLIPSYQSLGSLLIQISRRCAPKEHHWCPLHLSVWLHVPPDNLASCHEIVAISIIYDAAQNPLLRHQAYKGMWCWVFDHLKGAVPISISCLQIICLGHPRFRSTEWSNAHTALINVLDSMHTCTKQSTALPFSTLFPVTVLTVEEDVSYPIILLCSVRITYWVSPYCWASVFPRWSCMFPQA
jgi:hypothetical protein